MNRLQKKLGAIAQKVVDTAMGNGLSQEMTVPQGQRHITPGMPALVRRAAAEGCVLLKNDGTLPLRTAQQIAVFGRCQLDWFFVGYGSGGDVHAPYTVDLMTGLENAGAAYDKTVAAAYKDWTSEKDNQAYHGWWGHWPMSHPEMPLDAALVDAAAQSSAAAVVVIGRAAGEDRENRLEPGSYYLTDAETAMLDMVTAAFRHTVVVLNIGSIMDMAWVQGYGDKISALLIAWQGGMESGNAVADVLYGRVNPCGRLPDTIAKSYADYPSAANFGGREYNDYAEGIFVGYRHFDTYAPDRVLYPFGFGLGYTTFSAAPAAFARAQDSTMVSVKITNTGAVAGRQVVQLYAAQPQTGLVKAKRVLVAFAKTAVLAPGACETVRMTFDDRYIASYDEVRHAFVLEAGSYTFAVDDVPVGQFTLARERLVEQCEDIVLDTAARQKRILDRLPQALPAAAADDLTLADAAKSQAALDAFTAGLCDAELEALTRGHGMMGSPLGAPGNAGVLGGVLPSLRQKGVPPVTCCDGPAGLRMKRYCTLLPCGTALAAGFDTALTEELHRLIGQEMVYYGVDVQLAPGMNIHRNPLCGRNFEYFSEDPVLSGKMAAAVVRGVQSTGRSSCPKHFACNNQETKRNVNDSRVSERALREIYLRNFEICVKEGQPHAVMTAYNKVNGIWCHYHYDLVTTVLRREWGYTGLVMTDWWMRRAKSPEFPRLRDNAYRVRAGVDVLMPGDMGHVAKDYRTDGSLRSALRAPGGITKAELQQTAKHTLGFIIKLKIREEDKG